MAYRNLSTEQMVHISAEWLDPKGLRPVLLSIAIVAELVPKLEDVHQTLITRQPATSAILARVTALQEKQATLDIPYDRALRGSYGLLSSLADLTSDPSKAAAYIDLRDRLSPEGLRAILKSYTEKAGAAKMLPGRLDETARELLASIATPDGVLMDVVNAWTRTGRELGALEREKVALNQQLANEEGKVRPADVLKARNRWIRLAHALESNLEISAADEATVASILGSLHDGEAKANRRAGGAPGPASPNGTPGDDTKDGGGEASVAGPKPSEG